MTLGAAAASRSQHRDRDAVVERAYELAISASAPISATLNAGSWPKAMRACAPRRAARTYGGSSHEALCLLNAGDVDADVEITLYVEDRAPVGPYRIELARGRTRHLRMNDLVDPAPIPRDTAYAALVQSTAPIVVQHTRLDSRDTHIALLSTIAFPVD